GLVADVTIDRVRWIACVLNAAAGGDLMSPDEFQEVVRQVRWILEEVERGLPDVALWRELAEDAARLAAFERDDLPGLLAGPPPADWNYLDAHPEISRQEFEFIRGAWLERRPRARA